MGTNVRWIGAKNRSPLVHRPPYARLCAGPDCANVEQGGIVGRSFSAALRIRDNRVSEGHAMLSFRAGRLVLLGLRRKLLGACGNFLREVPLAIGVPVGLVDEIDVVPAEMHVPDGVALLAINEGSSVPLVNSAYSLRLDRDILTCEPGYYGDAVSYLTWRERGWVSMSPEGSVRRVHVGDRLVVGDSVLRFTEGRPRATATENTTGIVARDFPMRVVVRYDTVHLHRADRPSLIITGIAARIIGELAEFGVPTEWEMVARQIWSDGRDRNALRKNWDRHIGRLRNLLRDGRFPADLVRPDGCGNVELVLHPEDQLIDQT